MSSLQVVIPDADPLVPLLAERAIKRRMAERGRTPQHRKKLRMASVKLARDLLKERLGQLNENGDPMEVPAQ